MSNDISEIPVRLCCGQRHGGVVCPDKKVMCCLCFDRVDISDLNVLANGDIEDVCRKCSEQEARQIMTKLMELFK